jgi:uncharacterized membrane protein HdeD (DUF308 family)
VETVAQVWWIKLITAAGWLLFAVIVFRFDWTTVSALSILFGIVMIAAAVTQGLSALLATGWWRVAYLLLALAFLVIGIVAFVHPGGTFKALAAVLSFYFIIDGGFTIAVTLARPAEGERLNWLRLFVGIAELLLGFWAAGDFGHRAVLLVVWIGAVALARGFTDIFEAFALRGLAREPLSL